MRRSRRARLAPIVAVAAAAWIGCAAALQVPQRVAGDVASGLTEPFGLSAPGGMTMAELHSELAEFSARFAAVLGALGERIASNGAPPEVRREALLLRVQVVPLVQQHALDRNPRAGYVALLSLAVMLRQYASTESGGLDFGTYRPAVVKTMRRLETDLIVLGRQFLDPDRMARLRAEMEAFAREHALSEDFAVVQLEDSLVELEAVSHFASILEIPMTPFRALQGVDQGSAAIGEFSQTARGFASIVATLPAQLRWQLDLLLHETARSEGFGEMVAAFEQVAQSASRLTQVARHIPEDLTRSLEAAEAPLRELDRTLRTARELMGPLDAAAAQVAQAGTAWGGLVDGDGDGRKGRARQAAATGEPAAAQQEGPDLEAWRETAVAVGEASARLEAAADALRRLVGAEGDDGAAGIAQAGRNLIDYALWRIALLAAILVGLALLYRFLSPRLAPGSRTHRA